MLWTPKEEKTLVELCFKLKRIKDIARAMDIAPHRVSNKIDSDTDLTIISIIPSKIRKSKLIQYA